MESIESTGKTLSQAIENGLKELNKTEDEVKVEVLNMGGLFSKYKVLLTVIDKDAVKEETVEEKKEIETKEETQSEEQTETEAQSLEEEQTKEVIIDENAPDYLDEFLRGLFDDMQINAKFIISADDERINITIRSEENASKLIGKHGDTLKSIQYICRVVLDAKTKDTRKICADIEDYRTRRDEVLIRMATRVAHRVAKTRKKVSLEPMNSYERHVIHDALANDKFCTTYSEGTEPKRYIVIDLK